MRELGWVGLSKVGWGVRNSACRYGGCDRYQAHSSYGRGQVTKSFCPAAQTFHLCCTCTAVLPDVRLRSVRDAQVQLHEEVAITDGMQR